MTPIDLFSVFSVPSVADFRSKVQGGGISAEFLVLSFELHVISPAAFIQNMLVAPSKNKKV